MAPAVGALAGFVQAARQRSCPDTTPPPDASTTFASPANDDPTRSCRPGTGRCRLGRAEQSRFLSSRTGLRQWHIHWPRAPHAVTVPMENDASTAASPRPLPSAPTRNEGFETTRVAVQARRPIRAPKPIPNAGSSGVGDDDECGWGEMFIGDPPAPAPHARLRASQKRDIAEVAV